MQYDNQLAIVEVVRQCNDPVIQSFVHLGQVPYLKVGEAIVDVGEAVEP